MPRVSLLVCSLLIGCHGSSLRPESSAPARTASASAPAPSDDPRFDAELSGSRYPYPVGHFELTSQRQPLRMAYLDVRPRAPNGQTVLLLHGKNFSAAYWRPTIELLTERGYRVVAPDQVGFGKSSKPQGYQFSFQALAENTRALLRSLGVEKTSVVGHSMGGMLAARYALLYPANVHRLALVAPIGLEDWKRSGARPRSVDEWYQAELKATPESIRSPCCTSCPTSRCRPCFSSACAIARRSARRGPHQTSPPSSATTLSSASARMQRSRARDSWSFPASATCRKWRHSQPIRRHCWNIFVNLPHALSRPASAPGRASVRGAAGAFLVRLLLLSGHLPNVKKGIHRFPPALFAISVALSIAACSSDKEDASGAAGSSGTSGASASGSTSGGTSAAGSSSAGSSGAATGGTSASGSSGVAGAGAGGSASGSNTGGGGGATAGTGGGVTDPPEEGDFTCTASEKCRTECTAGDCTGACSGESDCLSQCKGGGCRFTCGGPGGTDEAECSFRCAGGDCDVTCQGNVLCDASCAMGGCNFHCADTANCAFSCAGGNCTYDCTTKETCNIPQ
ncbi:MAG: alpha/beta hydrolase [Polyangiaceae bacterium]|nr:alpha/beta hydrolase [Polyangiaceae bacterium]